MIKYDYVIKRDEGDEIRKYMPNLIPNELADVVYIEGPNSSGKSTLLNLIALSFFGLKLKEDELNPSLRERLKNLIESEHQEIQFNIELRNNKLSTYLKTTKSKFSSKDFQVRIKIGEKEKPIGSEQFHNEYKLIYDIPSNPLERLPQLLTEIKNAQVLRGHQVGALGDYIKKTIDEVLDSKDPKQIVKLKNKLKEQNKNYNKNESQLEKENKFFEGFQEFYFTKTYFDYVELSERVKEETRNIEKSKKEIKEDGKKQSKEVEALIKKIKENAGNAGEYFFKATNYLKILVPSSERHHLHIWLDSKCSDEIEQPDANRSLRQEADFFISYLPDLISHSDENKILEANFFRSLLQVLNDFSHTEITIPETDKNVLEFIKILEDKIQKYDEVMTKNTNIRTCIELIKDMKECIENGIQDTKTCKEIIDVYGETIDKIKGDDSKNKLIQLKEQQSFCEDRIKHFSKELVKINIDESEAKTVLSTLRYKKDFDSYEVYTESQLFDRLNSQKEKMNRLKEEKERLSRIIADTKSEVERIEKKKPHKYQSYLSKLEELHKVVQNLDQKLTVIFDQYIDLMINRNKEFKGLEEEEKLYMEQVAKFLAEKVHYIKHIKKNYLVRKIDVINEEIITDEKKIIRFKDIGTGQSQAAYLLGLLSMSDERKMIVLFDEVAMMDTITMKPIFGKLKSLYNDKKLLLGIIVQKADKVQVKNLV